jgi:hypothetical protein
MAVVINEFEAIAQQAPDRAPDGKTSEPPKIQPAMLRTPLQRLGARQRRLKAH